MHVNAAVEGGQIASQDFPRQFISLQNLARRAKKDAKKIELHSREFHHA